MLFTSIEFLYYFLPVVLIFYFILPNKARNFVLFISSMFFYFYGEPKYISLMLAEIVIAYVGAIFIDEYKEKWMLATVVGIHVGLLAIYKYTDFALENVNALFRVNIPLARLALPIGISFYTFQIISYVVDVYRGNVKVQRSFLKLATYVSLFPQLIAGPIVRYETVEEELKSRTHSFENTAYGVRRFTVGLAKKVLIANMLGEFCNVFNDCNEKTVILYWAFGISYMLQIYFDFSAYSDMAIGLGRIFGFHFLENFNYPYISKSITDFWRRWHISLSSWFRDYVYIPLGGNRNGTKVLVRNIFVVWLLTGIWHGASWNFVAWGLLFGIVLLIEKLWLGKFLEKLPTLVKRIYVLFIVMISFIIFYGPTLGEAFSNIAGLFGANCVGVINDYTTYYLKSYFVVFVIAFIGATPVLKNGIERLMENGVIRKLFNVLEIPVVVILLTLVTAYLVDSSYNPFLYFRF